jgi:hypothetical protein
MKRAYIPDIAEEDYDAFRVILQHHVPHSFEDWHKLKERLHRDVLTRGGDALLVRVDPEKFSEYLSTSVHDPDATGLIKFAREVATRPAD